ncbi:hypothetical protein CQW23_16453 [Capsicum baccatum]|uniref:KIB1-4 beta-propeller domain-containing protein n=1 Tax=Capsicum baccatum TaxID=33114 RepID=A0A2G2WAZ3_CAPBA|nr:hypothetical protein CQW23_16453 [Capsicum baccatum]
MVSSSVAVPWLMLSEKKDNAEIREFFDLSNGITHCMNLAQLVGKGCLSVGFPGYESKEELGMLKKQWFLRILSAQQIIFWPFATFVFWRPGDTSFTSLLTTIPDCAYSDITWHDGKFYGVNFMGDIVIVDSTVSPIAAARVVRWTTPDLIAGCQIYIVYSMGQLLVITRDGTNVSDRDGFRIFSEGFSSTYTD